MPRTLSMAISQTTSDVISIAQAKFSIYSSSQKLITVCAGRIFYLYQLHISIAEIVLRLIRLWNLSARKSQIRLGAELLGLGSSYSCTSSVASLLDRCVVEENIQSHKAELCMRFPFRGNGQRRKGKEGEAASEEPSLSESPGNDRSPQGEEAREPQDTEDGLQQAFDAAALRVESSAGSGAISQDDLLMLYGLYKQSTCGPCQTFRPSFFDIKGRSKW